MKKLLTMGSSNSYDTIPGIVKKVDLNPSQDIINDVIESAWHMAVKRLMNVYNLSEYQIASLMNNRRMAFFNVPKSHPSVSKKDIRRGWVGAMIDEELKLLSSYAVEYH